MEETPKVTLLHVLFHIFEIVQMVPNRAKRLKCWEMLQAFRKVFKA